MVCNKFLLWRCILMFLCLPGVVVFGDSREETTERRILYNNDDCNWFGMLCYGETDPARMKHLLEEEFVDRLAESGVDTLSVCLWDRFRSVGRSHITEYLVGPDSYRFFPDWQPLYDAGMDPIAIMSNRCRQQGVEFMVGMRMNDRHDDERFPKGSFIVNNPQWHLKGDPTPAGPGRKFGTRVDYTHDAVRQEVLDWIEEFLETYDVDGIELDYMRACHMFAPGTGAENAHKLTEFTRRTRELLDQAAKQHGRHRLQLGVRVPPSLRDCQFLGFALKSWAMQKLVDYVCTSYYVRTDLNIPVEEFVHLLTDTGCKVYPTIHPSAGFQSVPFLDGGTKVDIAGDLAIYRAAVSNYYAAGADGIQTYNYQHLAENHGTRAEDYSGEQFRNALSWIRELRDPKSVARGNRRYIFFPLWWPSERTPDGPPEAKNECGCSYQSPVVRLERGEVGNTGRLNFRIAEELGMSGRQVELRFKAIGLRDAESVAVTLNQFPVREDILSRTADRFNELHFATFTFPIEGELADQFVASGNQLEIRLVSDSDAGEGDVTVADLEVLVHETPGSSKAPN